jgi:glycosyltransferase involved in cell wall biosynthesis
MIQTELQTATSAGAPKLPLVSVIIPCYNGAAFISEAIDSVLAQSYPNVEIIVVNDGSTDDTKQVLDRYLGVITALHQPNGGLASARNTGLRAARGEFVALFDADDICQPERLSAQVAAMLQLPDVVLCSSDFSAFSGHQILDRSHGGTYYRVIAATAGGLHALYPNSQPLDTNRTPWPDATPSAPIELRSGNIYERLVWGNFVHPPTIMARRAAIAAAGEFDQQIANGTDYDWIMRVCRLGPAAYVNRPLLKYRYSVAQLSSPRNSAQLARDTILAMDKLKERDPALFQRHWARFQRRIGTCHLHAADALIETRKPRAAMELLHSLRHGIVTPTTLKVVVKLMLPRAVLAWRRRRRPVLADELHGRSAL